MLDDVYKVENRADVLILGGDFNNYGYAKTTLMLGFYPCSLWTCPAHYFTHTNNAHLSLTSLIDHIYTNNPSAVVTTVSDLSISDHKPISCTRCIKLPKPEPKGHTRLSFSSFIHFNQNALFADLICTPFDNVHQHTDPNEALAVWYKLFMDVVNRHAPIRHKRVKHPKLPPWLNKNIIQARSDRDRLKKQRMLTEYKTARNKVNIVVRNAKKLHFSKLVENNKNISSVWRAPNTFTKLNPL